MKQQVTHLKGGKGDIYLDVVSVLLVEPDPVQALLLRYYLETDGYYVRQVPDRETALRHCRKELFDVAVISDRGFPSLSGSLYREQLLPSLVLTGTARHPCWPSVTLPKPYSRVQFRAALHHLLQ